MLNLCLIYVMTMAFGDIWVGGIPTPLKNMSSSFGMTFPTEWKNKSHVPNKSFLRWHLDHQHFLCFTDLLPWSRSQQIIDTLHKSFQFINEIALLQSSGCWSPFFSLNHIQNKGGFHKWGTPSSLDDLVHGKSQLVDENPGGVPL